MVNVFFFSGDKFVVSIFTTSESESDSEAVRTGNNNRDKEAKLRLAALSLLAIVAKVCKTRFYSRQSITFMVYLLF